MKRTIQALILFSGFHASKAVFRQVTNAKRPETMEFRALAFTNHGANDSQRYRHQRRYPSLPHHGKRRPALSRRVQSRVNAAGAAKAYSGALSPPQQTERPSPAGTLTQPLSSHSHSPFRGNPNESNSLVHSPLRSPRSFREK